jgi:hypothetical protein
VRNLVDFYPDAGFVVTARPAALPEAWRKELRGLGFATALLEPMSRLQVNGFIDNWHRAKRIPGQLAAELKKAVSARRDLSSLTTSPLLCGVLCAVHLRRDAYVPSTRLELYETGAELLMERRDLVRAIRGSTWQLPRSISEPLLRRMALWMVLNGENSVPITTASTMAEESIRRTSAEASQYAPDVRFQVMRYQEAPIRLLLDLVEQTGIVRWLGNGDLEFSWPSFQDYLAASEIIVQDHVKHLVLNAHNPVYHDVIIMTADVADAPAATRLLTGLVERAATEESNHLWLLAAACVANVAVLPPDLKDRVGNATRRLLPPSNIEEAYRLAGGGFVLDLIIELALTRDLTDAEAAASLRVASLIDPVRTSVLLEHFGHRSSPRVQQELAAARARDSDT